MSMGESQRQPSHSRDDSREIFSRPPLLSSREQSMPPSAAQNDAITQTLPHTDASLDSESDPHLWQQVPAGPPAAHLSLPPRSHVVFGQFHTRHTDPPDNNTAGNVEMPKHLFSKIRNYEFKDFIQNARRPRRMDIVRGRKRRDVQCVLDTQAKASPSKLSLEKMLRDQTHLAAFRAFLRSEFSEENVEFWMACEDFRQTVSLGERSWKAEHIYQEFLHPNARREVNVDHCTRERIQGSLAERRPPAWCFDEAQRNIYLLMERDPWPRFLRSSTCHSLRHKTSTVWYI